MVRCEMGYMARRKSQGHRPIGHAIPDELYSVRVGCSLMYLTLDWKAILKGNREISSG